jgi:hypothetical protein
MVPGGGLEPPLDSSTRILSPLRGAGTVQESARRSGQRGFLCWNDRTIRRWSNPSKKLWAARPQDGVHRKPFYIGVAFANLVPDHLHTLSLFSNLENETRRTRLMRTTDALNHNSCRRVSIRYASDGTEFARNFAHRTRREAVKLYRHPSR